MKSFKSLAIILLFIPLIVFSVANREEVSVSLWPIFEGINAPLFFIFFAGIFLGLVLAWLIMGYRGVRHYTEMRGAKKEASKMSKEIDNLEGELDKKPAKVEQKNYTEDRSGNVKKLAKDK